MFNLVENLTNFIKDALLDGIRANLIGIFDDINTKVVETGQLLGQSPTTFNSQIYNFVKSINTNVMLPIAVLILTAIFCMNTIEMVTKKNKMQDVDIEDLYKLLFTTGIHVWLLTKSFDFVLAIFDISNVMINKIIGVIGSSNLTISDIESIITAWKEKGVGELMGLSLEITLLKYVILIISIIIYVIVYARMLEIYLYISVACIPFATLGNREWSSIGKGFIKQLIALALQAVFLIICMRMYQELVKNLEFTGNIHLSLLMAAAYTVLLVLTMGKSGSVAKSIVNAG